MGLKRRLGWPAGILLAAFTPTALAEEESPAAGLPLEEQVAVCGNCHGDDGNSTTAEIPSLAGQPALAITNQMIYFRERLRSSEVMTPQAQGLSDPEIEALAEYYSEQPVYLDEDASEKDDELMSMGMELASEMRCASCHGRDYSGQQQMPRLAGQREDYLEMTMLAYREGERGGPDTTMINIMRGVSDEDIEALAHFMAHAND